MRSERLGLLRIEKMRSFSELVFWIFLNWNRNSQDSPKVMCLRILFISAHFSRRIRQGANLDVLAFKISNTKTFFLKLVQANLLSLQNKAN